MEKQKENPGWVCWPVYIHRQIGCTGMRGGFGLQLSNLVQNSKVASFLVARQRSSQEEILEVPYQQYRMGGSRYKRL